MSNKTNHQSAQVSNGTNIQVGRDFNKDWSSRNTVSVTLTLTLIGILVAGAVCFLELQMGADGLSIRLKNSQPSIEQATDHP